MRRREFRMREHHRRLRLTVTGVLAALVAGSLASTARAGGTTAGTWTGTLSMDNYPCPTGTCGGSLAGSLVGTVAGVDPQGSAFTVTWPDPTAPVNPTARNLAASFLYTAGCPVGQAGHASGSFTLAGGYVDDGGAISHDGTITGQLDALLLGLAVVVSTSGSQLTGNGKVLAMQVVAPGPGVGAFAPTPTANCLGSVASINAPMAGGYGTAQ